MKEFKNFVPVEIKNHLELIVENIDNISEMKREKDVDFFMNETMRLIEMLKNDVEYFAEFQKNNNNALSPNGKAQDFDSCTRWFKSNKGSCRNAEK